MLSGPALARFQKKLLVWFAVSQRDLPWRRTKDPYRIWLSEIMLQQTRVATVLPYYERFIQRFPDVRALAETPEEEVLRLWAGLGYYSRARNLQKAAQMIVEKHGSRFPKDEDEALQLPGIGEYTVAAILSIAYGKKLAVLDGNVARVLARLGALRGNLRDGKRWRKLQDMAGGLLETRRPSDWNQAMMELGATMCTPRSPQCLLCPVGEFCEARKKGLTEVIPEKREKRAKEEITLAALVVLDAQGRTLLWPPPRHADDREQGSGVADLLSGLWHFPTIQVRDDAEAELRRYTVKRIWGGKRVGGKLRLVGTARHTVTYRRITVQVFAIELAQLPRPKHAKTLALNEPAAVPISNLTRKITDVVWAAKNSTAKKVRMAMGLTNADDEGTRLLF